uniref:Uncharacterized protein n=1 Tax=Peronospora matthiolae TaxID=2874970 RepID=A0AAV1UWE0_9STRA
MDGLGRLSSSGGAAYPRPGRLGSPAPQLMIDDVQVWLSKSYDTAHPVSQQGPPEKVFPARS